MWTPPAPLDGLQRFVVAVSPRKAAPLAYVRVVVNWFEELRRLAPRGGQR